MHSLTSHRAVSFAIDLNVLSDREKYSPRFLLGPVTSIELLWPTLESRLDVKFVEVLVIW